MDIHIKRIYEERAPEDGYRVLVDRIWPRGVSRERAAIDEWLKEVAPSTDLRRWFAHEVSRWGGFKQRYFTELANNPSVERLLERTARGPLTLVYSARDEAHNQAVALREYLLAVEPRSQSL